MQGHLSFAFHVSEIPQKFLNVLGDQDLLYQ